MMPMDLNAAALKLALAAEASGALVSGERGAAKGEGDSRSRRRHDPHAPYDRRADGVGDHDASPAVRRWAEAT